MKDLNGFLKEDKDKSKPRPKSEASKSSSKTKKRKQSKGKDDERYVSLMDEYKRMRRHNHLEANAIHDKAIRVKRDGDVSKDAITAGQYI